MISMWDVAMLIIALVVVKISHWLYRWSNPKCNGKLPPGSMGYPIIGETFDFFTPSAFNNIPPFLTKRMIRYGPLFRTNIFGSKTVISTDADVNFQIFREDNKSFELGYPDIFTKVFGKDNPFSTGGVHKYLRKITTQFIGPETLKQTLMEHMDKATRNHFRLKAGQGSFNVRQEVQNLVVAYMTPKLISTLKPETQAKVIDYLNGVGFEWLESFFSLSTWKAIKKVHKSRGEVIKVIMKDALWRRKESREKRGDFLNTMLEELEKDGSIFNQASAIDLIFILAVASREAPSFLTALIVKFIAAHPKVLAELKREHKAIIDNRKDKEAGLSWEEYRQNMSFTNMVINESLRLSNGATPILFRKAVHDIEINGYTIPAGWIVAVSPSVVHYDPAIYENPYEFNPWRWEGKEMVWGSKTFMVFGGGVRLCAGAEFTRLQIAIFLHHLVAYYDFSLVQDCEVTLTPFLKFTKELVINISQSPTE